MYLCAHSYYSLRYGTIEPEQLLQMASEAGIGAIALTDINNTSACLDFIRLAPKYNIKPVVGIDFRTGIETHFIAIAKNNAGYAEINFLLSNILAGNTTLEKTAPSFENAYVIYPFQPNERSFGFQKLKENEYIGILPEQIGRLRFHEINNYQDKLVILAPITFRNKRDFNAHRLLRAIDNNIILSKLPKSEEANENEKLIPPTELSDLFEDFPQIIANTQFILENSNVHFEFGHEAPMQNQLTYTGSVEKDYELVRQLAYEGLDYRYPQQNEAIISRIEKELAIIKEKNYLSYFLINWDITRYAREKGYFYVGRGSGANSILAYLLRITDVDPIELDLYFERFINLYRKNPPDFDIDFSWTDREDMTNYIFSKFQNVCLLGAYVTFQYKAVVRELGKVFGLPKTDIDLLSDGKFEYDKLDSLQQLVLQYSALIQDFPNQLSIHAAGILITEKPIQHFCATFMPPKGYPTTQFDMVVAEDVGIYKFDILSQRGLGKIKECLDIIAYNQPEHEPFDIHDMRRFKADENIKDLLRNAKAIGCFYVESPAMRMLLTKLQVDDYLGLVAASSVIRPGVSRSGMMKAFIQRHRFPERRKDAHPIMLDIMPETYGVMVYQEDVIKVAHYFGGLDLGEADSLRRGMSGKFRGREEFDQARQAFFRKASEKGHPEDMIAEVWRQIESFAGYAFAKGHSASYAVESYQSLFLKAYYPLEYMTATINNFGGFYSTELYVHEARMHGAKIEPPCVQRGSAVSVIYDRTIILGMGLVKDIEHDTIIAILDERKKNGEFEGFEDFLNRVRISLEQVATLIRVGAFRFTLRSKKELMWAAHFQLASTKMSKPDQGLFPTPVKSFSLPPLEHSWIEDAYDELELIGFPLCNPFDLLQTAPGDDVPANALPQLIGKNVTVVGYLVTIKPSRTAKGDRMYFGTFIDREGYFLDTVHFPPAAQHYQWRGKGIYVIKGKVMEEFGAISIEATYLEKLRYMDDPRYL